MAEAYEGDRARLAAMRERPTLKTIAFMTGLGITTVSRALKDAPDIGAETKERVRMVARQLGYQPNRAGVRLRTGKTNVIALVLSIDEEIMGFSSQMIFGISEVLSGTPYHVVVTPHSHSKDPMLPVRYILDTGSADGVIISRIEPDDPRVRLLEERNMPFATHGRTSGGVVHPYHDFDNEAFGYTAVEKLVKRGRRRIALLSPPKSLTYCAHTRAGFDRALKGCDASEVPVSVDIDTPLADLNGAMEALMRSPERPDGIVCSSSSAAIAANAAIETAGLKLGHDVDLVSKQGLPILNWIRPEIITALEDVRLAGRELAKAVIARIDGISPDLLQSISQPAWPDETR
ncbi:substrate-binding domain-containing protein [Ciceribacter sp. L1K23]|uniref:LacI family transcriptional regulator n=1 Tax=unclassified Ciceribacter TaxID=2628820 RepID=UPI001ABEE82D|nr:MULTISPECIES: LacI family transcriptional regulator [unclassified Ciceribacter]MBO3760515.1 substrate-binding domain-containing protein [Ciceribacter sp. L1K22]MBR0555427.1 substrate-binding domain-containing protein [Ciceribacter sp. L1K23]